MFACNDKIDGLFNDLKTDLKEKQALRQAQPATVFQNCTFITGSKAVVNTQPQDQCCPWRYVLAVLAALAVLLGLVKVEGPHTQPPGLWA